jgi:hypothetical protein
MREKDHYNRTRMASEARRQYLLAGREFDRLTRRAPPAEEREEPVPGLSEYLAGKAV